MKKLEGLRAAAKLNLSLDVLRRREDGYHELRMVMHSVPLCDELTLTPVSEPAFWAESNMRYLPGGERNLAVAAARLYYRRAELSGGLRIELHKRIPVGAGLGGGSSDAAAVLRGLNEVHRALDAAALHDLALECGSDVPYCLRGGTQLAEGRGERLTVLPELPPCRAVLCKPPVSVSTAEVFGLYRQNRRRMRPDTEGLLEALRRADLPGVCRRMYNALEDGVAASLRDVAAIRAQLIAGGALGAVMSGSGPTVFGLFDDDSAARRTYEALRADYAETFLV